MVHGDLNDISTLVAAFQGVNVIYAVTDFWQPFFDPSSKAKLKPGQIMNQFCHDLELQQGKNLANAAATVETLERYVCSALTNFEKWSKGKYKWVYHFDGKAKVVDYIKETLPELAAKMSVLQIGLYTTHWQAAPFLAPQKVNAPLDMARERLANAKLVNSNRTERLSSPSQQIPMHLCPCLIQEKTQDTSCGV